MEREYYGRRRRASFGFSVCCPKCDTELMRTCLRVDEVLECPKCGYKMYVFVDKDMCIMMPQEQTDNTQIVNQMRQFVTAAGHGDFESCDDCQQFNDNLRISDLMESYDGLYVSTADVTGSGLTGYYNQRLGIVDSRPNAITNGGTEYLSGYGIESPYFGGSQQEFNAVANATYGTGDDQVALVFDGWYACNTGDSTEYVKVSTDRSYQNRVTNNMYLYAGYRPVAVAADKVTVSVSDVKIDRYADVNGVEQVRFNSQLNVGGEYVVDSDPNIKYVSAIYFDLPTTDNEGNAIDWSNSDNKAALQNYLTTVDSTSNKTGLETIRGYVESHVGLVENLSNFKSNGDVGGYYRTYTTKNWTVKVTGVTTTEKGKVDCFTFKVITTGTPDVDSHTVKLTTKNRIEFTRPMTYDEYTSNPFFVFIAVKYDNTDTANGSQKRDGMEDEDTIYFKHGAGSFATNAYAYLYTENEGSPTLMNAAWPGVAMTKTKKLYNGSYVADDFCYSYTYYYPKLTNSDIDDYAKVIFNNNDTKQSRDEDSAMPESNGINCFTLGGYSNTAQTRYYLSSSDLTTNGTVSLEIEYYNQKVADSASEATFTKGNLLSTTTTASVTNGDVASGISTACTNMHMTNLYDKFTFYGSQFAYVKALASDIDSRLSTTEPRAAFINPANLAKPSTAFSGVYSDSENVLTDISSESERDWVEYYYEDKDNNVTKTKVDFTQVNPELSNLTSIKVNAFYMPRTYIMNFIIGENAISETCSYNQLLSTAAQRKIKTAIEKAGGTFDGWYIKDGTKELKISSEPDYKYRITQSRTLYAKFRTDDRPAHKATAIADPIDVFSENGTTMYRYNTLLNICDLGDNDSNITDVGIVYVKLGTSQKYDLDTVRSSILSNVVGKSTTPENITVKNTDTANIKYNAYSVSNGQVLLTSKNRLQFNLKLTEAQAADSGKYANVLAFTVYKYNGTWHVSENCVHYTGRTFTEIE